MLAYMKNKTQSSLALKFRSGSVLFAVCAVLLGPGWGVQRGLAQLFPAQGDDSTFSMGVFRITVEPGVSGVARGPLVAPSEI